MAGVEEIRENGHMAPSPSQQDDGEQQKVKKPTRKMSYEEYKQMANLLVLHMRRVEDSVTDGKFVHLLVSVRSRQIMIIEMFISYVACLSCTKYCCRLCSHCRTF